MTGAEAGFLLFGVGIGSILTLLVLAFFRRRYL